jgi:hypothetical protein
MNGEQKITVSDGRKANLLINFDVCRIMMESIETLRAKIGLLGLHKATKKIKRLRNMH